MLISEKIWHEHLTDLSTSLVRCSHFTLGNPKSHFSTLLLIHFRLFTLAQKKTSSNCCSAALDVYLLLLSASCYLHRPSTVSGARYRRSACMDVLRHIATWAEFQHSMVTERYRKRLEACINAEDGHFEVEHLLWHCLPDIPVATCHNWFFLEPPTTTHNWLFSEPPTFERTQQTFSQI